MEELNSLSVSELRQMAKEKGINGYSSMKKSELVEALSDKAPAKQEKPAETVRTVRTEKAEEVRPVRTERPAEQVRPARESAERPAQMRQERPVSQERPMQARPSQPMQQARPERPAQSAQTGYADRNAQPGQVIRRTVGDPSMAVRQSAPVSGENAQFDSGISKTGILEIAPEQSFGFIRNENYLPSPDDIYVSPALIKRYNLTTGDIICGNLKIKSPAEKFVAMLYITKINGENPELSARRKRFDKLTPVFPHDRLRLETPGGPTSVRIVDLLSPIGKGQRGMIVSPPKAGKTTLLKDIARAVQKNNPDLHMIILLIDERPEEVTDMKDSIKGDNVEIIYSTFDEAPEQHKRVSEMTVEHAKRLVEYGKDVIILLDSITRLARAYNLTCQSSGRTLSGGLDPAALYMPKRFFGAARCMKEGGSLTILATALVDTGSRMDDVVFEEFKGTGNMELTLNRALSERRIFPAIDLPKSSTRREDLLLSPVEQEANLIMRRAFGGARAEEATEQIVNMFTHTRSNAEFITQLKRTRVF